MIVLGLEDKAKTLIGTEKPLDLEAGISRERAFSDAIIR